jgi:bifunctional non-homologous end joining protein LigD
MATKKNETKCSSRHPKRAAQRSTPAFIEPMVAQLVKKLPEGNDWIYEVKFDGYRGLLIKNGQRVEIRSRKEKDLTKMYPSIADAALRVNAKQAVIDGEIVALDSQGRPTFQALQHRSTHRNHQIVFYAFDLLHLGGRRGAARVVSRADSTAVRRSPTRLGT